MIDRPTDATYRPVLGNLKIEFKLKLKLIVDAGAGATQTAAMKGTTRTTSPHYSSPTLSQGLQLLLFIKLAFFCSESFLLLEKYYVLPHSIWPCLNFLCTCNIVRL